MNFSAKMLRDNALSDKVIVVTGGRWPGNVRELRNMVERVVLLEDGERLEVEHLPSELQGRRVSGDETIPLPTLAPLCHKPRRRA